MRPYGPVRPNSRCANDRQAICRRVFPGRPDSLGVSLYAEGGSARFSGVKAWEMAASNPY